MSINKTFIEKYLDSSVNTTELYEGATENATTSETEGYISKPWGGVGISQHDRVPKTRKL